MKRLIMLLVFAALSAAVAGGYWYWQQSSQPADGAAKAEKGSGKPNTEKVGKISKAQLKQIAEEKFKDFNTADLEAAMRTITGTARSMGITVEA